MKYVFSEYEVDGSFYLDGESKYLKCDYMICYYCYVDFNGMVLVDLDNSNIEVIC